ncbi:MAG: hypothetical protein MJ231_02210 [bacterium]|nr:hypothetical protein [bacterium]
MMTLEEKKELCNCAKCEDKCIHEVCYRRLPVEVGGLGLCERLKEELKKENN